jgi:hypothetical protein
VRELTEVLPRFADSRTLAGELIQRGWLTPYQVNQLFQEKGEQLLLGPYVLLATFVMLHQESRSGTFRALPPAAPSRRTPRW